MFNAQHFLMFAETKHFFRALAMTFWPWPIFGIFLAKKTPKMALGPKNLGAAQFFFVLPHVDIVVHFTLKYIIFTCIILTRNAACCSLREHLSY